jgi:hypothetical protein
MHVLTFSVVVHLTPTMPFRRHPWPWSASYYFLAWMHTHDHDWKMAVLKNLLCFFFIEVIFFLTSRRKKQEWLPCSQLFSEMFCCNPFFFMDPLHLVRCWNATLWLRLCCYTVWDYTCIHGQAQVLDCVPPPHNVTLSHAHQFFLRNQHKDISSTPTIFFRWKLIVSNRTSTGFVWHYKLQKLN